jgi:ribosomal 30S subunit maturation factor RimM
VKRAEAPPRALELRSGRKHILKGHDVWLVKLEGVTNREQAAELRGFR